MAEEVAKIPVASPRKSIQEYAPDEIIVPDIEIVEHYDEVISELIKEQSEANSFQPIKTIQELAKDMVESDHDNDKEVVNGVVDQEVPIEEVNDVQVDDEPSEDANDQAEEPLTISDTLAKEHFPQLLDRPDKVFEVQNKSGQVVEQWYTVEMEKGASNVEVLEKLEGVVDEVDRADIKKLLAWARSKGGKSKTNTMVIREKKKAESFRRAVNFDAVPIIIENRNYDRTGNTPPTVSTVGNKRFQVAPAKPETFQVRRRSVIQPVSETVVTRSWLENAIRVYEDEPEVVLVNMRFDRDKTGAYQASVTAELGPNKVIKTFAWIIRARPQTKEEYDPGDKDTFMIASFGTRLVRFVAGLQKGIRTPGQGAGAAKMTKSLNMPFQPIIFADTQYAIFDDMADFKVQADETGLNMDHMRLALKTLARLHGMSYAYFNNAKTDLKLFSRTLKLMIDKFYQPSASSEDRAVAKKQLGISFDHMIKVVGATNDGAEVAGKAKAKYGDRLYNIYKEAHVASSGNFSVLCHGFPTQANFRFSYEREPGQLLGKVTDAKLVNFKEARFGNAVTDVQLLLCSSMGPKVEEQAEFLFRFVYHETLIATLKSLEVDPPQTTDFDNIYEDFKKQQVYGSLAAAMHLAQVENNIGIKTSQVSSSGASKRIFQSKLLGGVIGKGDPKVYKTSTPALRAKALIEKLVS